MFVIFYFLVFYVIKKKKTIWSFLLHKGLHVKAPVYTKIVYNVVHFKLCLNEGLHEWYADKPIGGFMQTSLFTFCQMEKTACFLQIDFSCQKGSWE